MRTILRRSWLVVVPWLLAGGTARAEHVVEVTVPFPFVVQDHALPAGRYRFERDLDQSSAIVIRPEDRTRQPLVVSIMTPAGHDPAGEQPAVVFTRHEKTYVLKDVWEDRGDGQEVTPLR